MKKKLLSSLFIVLLTYSGLTLAQNSDIKNSQPENLPTQSESKEDLQKALPNQANLDESTKNAKDKLDSLTPIKNSELIDNIQGGMANLLLGNKATSLMFDDRENDDIDRAIEAFKNNQAYIPENADALDVQKTNEEDFNQKSYVYLASILYVTPQDWVVWINDKKITSETNKKNQEIFLRSVEKDRVSILWNISPTKLKVLLGAKVETSNLKINSAGEAEVKFALQPNQAFVLGSNKVVEGRSVTNMIQKKADNQINEKNTEVAGEKAVSSKSKLIIKK